MQLFILNPKPRSVPSNNYNIIVQYVNYIVGMRSRWKIYTTVCFMCAEGLCMVFLMAFLVKTESNARHERWQTCAGIPPYPESLYLLFIAAIVGVGLRGV